MIGRVYFANNFFHTHVGKDTLDTAKFNDSETARLAQQIEPQVLERLKKDGPECLRGTIREPCFQNYITGSLYRVVLPDKKEVLFENVAGEADTYMTFI